MRRFAALVLLSLAFAAPAQAADIPGSWSESCDPASLFIRGNLMSARCATPDGGTMASAIDVSTCGPEPRIGVAEGRLVCEGATAEPAREPVKVVVLNDANSVASFAGSWQIVAGSGETWPLQIAQQGNVLTGSYDAEGAHVEFRGLVVGSRAVASWTLTGADGSLDGGEQFELVLFGNGKSIGASFLDKSDGMEADDFLARRVE